MDEYAGDGGNGLDASSIFSSIASLGSTAIQEFGPAQNTALLQGQSIYTPNLSTATGYAAPSSTPWLLIILAVVVGIFAFKKV